MGKRTLLVLLTLAGLMTVLTGCGATTTTTPPTSSNPTAIEGVVKVSAATSGVTGTAVDGLVPLAGATVSLFRVGSNGTETLVFTGTSTTGTDGHYILSGLPAPVAGTHYLVRARKDVSVSGATKTIELTSLLDGFTTGKTVTQDLNPVLDFTRTVVQVSPSQFDHHWWTWSSDDVRSLRDIVLPAVQTYVAAHTLPDLTDATAIQSYLSGFSLGANQNFWKTLLAIVERHTSTVSIPSGASYTLVETDAVNDLYGPGGPDLVKVEASRSASTLSLQLTFASDPVLRNSTDDYTGGACVSGCLFSGPHNYFALTPAGEYEVQFMAFGDKAQYEVDQYDSNAGATSQIVPLTDIADSLSGTTLTFTLDLSSVPSLSTLLLRLDVGYDIAQPVILSFV